MSEISDFVLFFDKKQQNKDDVFTSYKKRYTLRKLWLYYMGFLLNFRLKSHLPLFFNLCVNSPLFIYFLTKSNQKRRCASHKKNVTFCENFCCIILGFCSIFVRNLTFCSFSVYELNITFWPCTSHKKRYILWKR